MLHFFISSQTLSFGRHPGFAALGCTARHGVACVIETLNIPVSVSALFFACRISRVRGLSTVPNIPPGVGPNAPLLIGGLRHQRPIWPL